MTEPSGKGQLMLGAGRRWLRAGVAVVCISALLFVVPLAPASAAEATPVTYDNGPYNSGASTPTADKPQSKLWYAHGAWWSLRVPAGAARVNIFELLPNHTWRDTGTLVDTRANSTGDALWDGSRLYVASRVASGSLHVTRFTFNSSSRAWSMDSGFPAAIQTGGSESATIDKDSTGRLWVTWTRSSRVWVTHTTTDDRTWAAPFNPPTPGTSVAADDISAVVSLEDRIVVMWSNQAAHQIRAAVHRDSDPVGTWSGEVPLSGNNLADDHLNLKQLAADPQGRVFAVVKTSMGDSGEPSTSPLVVLLVRSSTGVWTRSTVATRADSWTRPQLLLDASAQRLYVLATAPEGGGTIHYKTAALSNPSFPAGIGPVFMSWPAAKLNNVSTTKQTVDSTTGIVAMASDSSTRRYYHAELRFGPADTTPPSTPTNLRATAASPTQVNLSWTASTDDSAVTGYDIYRDSVRTATVSGTSWSDTGVSPSTTYTYRVAARDGAGNVSPQSTAASVTTPEPSPDAGIVRRGATFASNPTATTLTLPRPSAAASGDILVAVVSARGGPTLAAPAGWNLVRQDVNSTTMRQAIWWRLAGTSEPTSYTWTLSSSQAAAGGIVAYTGVSNSAPIAASGGQVNPASTSIVAPSIEVPTSGAALVGFFGTAGAATVTAPAAMTGVGQAASTAGQYKIASAGAATDSVAAGPTGTRTASASTTTANVGQLLALRPP